MDINRIRQIANEKKIIWRNHILVRMRNRGIKINDVINCIRTGDIIETYENDYPYPSVLIAGCTENSKHIHVVCAEGQGMIWMITSYYPDSNEWLDDMRTRRR